MVEVSILIQDGAAAFLKSEYAFTFCFILVFAVIIATTVENEIGTFYTTVPFVIGAITSIASGTISMMIAVRANIRTAIQA